MYLIYFLSSPISFRLLSAEFNLLVLLRLACFEISPITHALIFLLMSRFHNNVPRGWILAGMGNDIHPVINAFFIA
ncbi:hypothetical protein BDV23DRAFT_90440 [Aspergillus alliaceus]|uniref:Uncharacterized protein n=1 Tax=Petromyces alliaceus TaxID=209559 RepID=A0A5N7C7M6_PETAA|nr:hypothetical protein BDV23DRAFT_90440 [Aspergillus alliaceus]